MKIADTLKSIGDFFEKFGFGLFFTIAVFIAIPIACGHNNFTASPSTWITVFTTLFFILLKGCIGDIASDGDFKFHKYGFDNCMLAFSAAFTALIVQVQADKDIFKGFIIFPIDISEDPIRNRLMHLTFFFIITILFALWSARNSGKIKAKKARERGWLAFCNFVSGSILLALYVYFLQFKNQ